MNYTLCEGLRKQNIFRNPKGPHSCPQQTQTLGKGEVTIG